MDPRSRMHLEGAYEAFENGKTRVLGNIRSTDTDSWRSPIESAWI